MKCEMNNDFSKGPINICESLYLGNSEVAKVLLLGF